MNRIHKLGMWLALSSAAWAGDAQRLVYRIDTVAGNGSLGDGGPAVAAQMGTIQGIATDRLGNVYLSDTDHNRVRKIDLNGVITTLAGTGVPGFSGDGGPATAAQLNLPYGLAVDLLGNVYIADLQNSRIRRVAPDGAIATYAGAGGQGSSGDGGPATNAQMLTPRNVAVDAAGNLYISEFSGHRIRKVTPDGRISTVAGTGLLGFKGDGGAATAAQLSYPAGLALDRLGVLYIADSGNQRIRKLLPGGQITTAFGGANSVTLLTPIGVAVDLAGDLFVADQTAQIRELTIGGKTIAAAGNGSPGFSGDGGRATDAQLAQPLDIAGDLWGNLCIADQVRVRKVDAAGTMHTLAGDAYLRAIGDGGGALQAVLHQPASVAVDGAGNLYVADRGTARVRRVASDGTIQTVAGTGVLAPATDGGTASLSPLMNPEAVAIDSSGQLLIVEMDAHRVRQIDAGGKLRTVIGTGAAGLGPELLPPTDTALRAPRGFCTDRSGNLYVADTSNNRVLLLPPGGLVSTAAGNGSPGWTGDGGRARGSQLAKPGSCAVDSVGNLYIADTYNHAVRKVDVAGVITTVAGSGVAGFGGDDSPATAATLNLPAGVAADDNGNIYISDTGNNRIRQVTPDGVIHTIAGTGAAGFAGDGGAALNADLDGPAGILLDGSGDLYFADANNDRLRRLTPAGVVLQPPVAPMVPLTVVNAASLAGGSVAPGEIVTIFGAGLGPQTGVGALVDTSGLLTNRLAAAEVRFDGVPAPLLYVQAGQINAQVPYTTAGAQLTHVEVFFEAQPAGATDLAVVDAAPGIFSTVVNQDGSFNSQGNPAARGTYLTLYATGAGLADGANTSGLPAAAPYARPLDTVGATVGAMNADIQWSGSAPGLVGLLQVNLRVPGAFVQSGAEPLAITVGLWTSPAVQIWVQ